MPDHATIATVVSACVLVLAWVLTYVVHSTILLGSAWIVTRRLSTRLSAIRDTVWKIALLGGFVTASVQLAVGFEPFGGQVVLPVDLAGLTGRWWPALVVGGWILLAAFLLIRLAHAHWRLSRVLSGRVEEVEGHLTATVDRLSRLAGFDHRVRISLSLRTAVPIAFGRREICLPERAIDELGSDEQAGLIAHELAHLVRRDPIWLRVSAILERVFFFQPLNAVARREIQECAEYLCDDHAARLTGGGVALARCLATVAAWLGSSRGSYLVAEASGSRSSLVRRVEHLLDDASLPTPGARYRAAAALGTILIVAITVPGVTARQGAPDHDALLAVARTAASTPSVAPAPAVSPTPTVAPAPSGPLALASASAEVLLMEEVPAPVVDRPDAGILVHPEETRPSRRSGGVADPSDPDCDVGDRVADAGTRWASAQGGVRAVVDPGDRVRVVVPDRAVFAETDREIRREVRRATRSLARAARDGGDLDRVVRDALAGIDRADVRELTLKALHDHDLDLGEDLTEDLEAALEEYAEAIEEAVDEASRYLVQGHRDHNYNYNYNYNYDYNYNYNYDYDYDYDHDYDHDHDGHSWSVHGGWDDDRTALGRDERALVEAVADGHLDETRDLLAEVDADLRFGPDLTLLHLAGAENDPAMVSLLLQHAATLDAADHLGRTALHVAAAESGVEVARALLEAGASPTLRDQRDRTPLHLAAREGNLDVVDLLLARDEVRVDAIDDRGRTPLLHALAEAQLDVVRRLLDAGADADARDDQGVSPLHFAVGESDLDAVRLLLDHGADVNGRDDHGITPLHRAVIDADFGVLQLLLDSGADAHREDDDRRTPLDYADDGGWDDVRDLLRGTPGR